jgi:serine/threonine-protein kinase
MGEVYRARDIRLGRLVALKVLPDTFAADPRRRARFLREAQVLASLNHSNISTLHGVEELDGRLVLVLELVEGETLGDRLARASAPLPVREVVPIARQIVDALDAAHELGIVHRDLKPDNAMYDHATGMLKLLDFGIAAATDTSQDERLTRAGYFVGTLMYVAPEALSGALVTPAADQYSLATISYLLLTGTLPYTAKSPREMFTQLLSQPPIALNRARPGLDFGGRVEAVVTRGLAREPAERYADVVEFATALRSALTEPASVGAAPPAGTATSSPDEGLLSRMKGLFRRT